MERKFSNFPKQLLKATYQSKHPREMSQYYADGIIIHTVFAKGGK